MPRVTIVPVLLTALVAALVLPGAGEAAARGLLAPASVCPGGQAVGGAVAAKVRTMRCLTNFARQRRGKPRLRHLPRLDRAARGKAADILRCDEFDHEACGREFTYWFERVGYRGRCTAMGENIAWGTGSLGSPRAIFRAWLASPGHRANVLGAFAELGIGLRTGDLEGNRRAQVWTQAFGSRSC